MLFRVLAGWHGVPLELSRYWTKTLQKPKCCKVRVSILYVYVFTAYSIAHIYVCDKLALIEFQYRQKCMLVTNIKSICQIR